MAQSDTTGSTHALVLCGAESPTHSKCVRSDKHGGDHSDGEFIWRDPDTGPPFIAGVPLGGGKSGGPSAGYAATHGQGGNGGSASGAGFDGRAAPPLGPVPERFRHVATGDPRPKHHADTLEVLLAGLVACGRSLGQIDKEMGTAAHFRRVLSAGLKGLGVGPDSELTDEQWGKLGRYLYGSVQLVVDEKSQPFEPIQARAEALAILIMQGQRVGVPPNFLIRAGAVLEVLRAVWRKAQRGGT
jgi:hypothetical protein